MCLCTVYTDTNGQTKKILQDVTRVEAGKDGYMFVDLFGKETFIRGRLMRMDFIDDNAIVIKTP